jgi:Ca-activated chloride channel family protein
LRFWTVLVSLFVILSGAVAASAQDAQVTAPATAVVGEEIKVDFTGPNGAGDWVGLAPVGSAGDAWVGSSYAYTSTGSPAKFPAPPAFGRYEVRYVTATNQVLASQVIEIVAAGGAQAGNDGGAAAGQETLTAKLEASDTVAGGGEILVEFSGPGGEDSYLTILRANDPSVPRLSGSSALVTQSPARLRIPAEAGQWEIRYVAGGKIVGRRPLAITEPPQVRFEGRDASPGEAMVIAIEGAQRVPGDYFYIARAASPDDDYSGGYTAIHYKGPVSISAPQEAGDWEMRYVVPFDGSYKALGRARLTVK